MKTHAEIYQAYLDGNTLTTAEVNAGLEHFSTLANYAAQSGPAFSLMKREALRVAQYLESVQTARNFRG